MAPNRDFSLNPQEVKYKEPKKMLSEIKQYLMTHKRVALGDLALHFDTDAGNMKDILGQWIRKGKIAKSDLRASCNATCARRCDQSAMEIYEWVA